MKKTSAKPPRYLALNAIDRSYLIPETEDINGPYFPLSPLGVVTLNHQPTKSEIVAALKQVETHLPQLRLAYTLDIQHSRWQRLPDDQLSTYFDQVVRESPDPAAPLEDVLAQLVCNNIAPFNQPLSIMLHQKHIIIKVNHSLSDGMLGALILNSILTALVAPQQLDNLPAPAAYEGVALWKLITQSRQRLFQVFRGWFKTLHYYYPSTQPDLLPRWHNPDRQPLRSGSAMCVKLHVVPQPAINTLKHMKAGLSCETSISMNTLLQVLLAHRLHALGYLGQQVTYTIPVDLHRYLDNPAALYTGNLASQIRVEVSDHPLNNILAHCQTVQTEVEQKLAEGAPLFNIPYEWLLRLAGRKTYNRLNRDWFLESINTDPRLFVFSNLGNMTRAFRKLDDLINFESGMYTISPLMGGPPLIVTFNIVNNQGNLGITYDPQIFSSDQIDAIFDGFEADHLAEILNEQETAHVLAH